MSFRNIQVKCEVKNKTSQGAIDKRWGADIHELLKVYSLTRHYFIIH